VVTAKKVMRRISRQWGVSNTSPQKEERGEEVRGERGKRPGITLDIAVTGTQITALGGGGKKRGSKGKKGCLKSFGCDVGKVGLKHYRLPV